MDSTLRTDLYHKGKTNLDARGCMGPPPLTLGMVHEEGLYRRMQAKGMVGLFYLPPLL